MIQYKTGELVEVRLNSSDMSIEKWVPAIFKSYISATDRPYRFNIELTNGIKLNGVTPECVRKKK